MRQSRGGLVAEKSECLLESSERAFPRHRYWPVVATAGYRQRPPPPTVVLRRPGDAIVV
jgi:hypothetical protein